MASGDNPLRKKQASISLNGRILIVVVAFLGWGFAGVQMAITSLATRSAAIELMSRTGSLNLEEFNSLNQQKAQVLKAEKAEERGEPTEATVPLTAKQEATLTAWKGQAAQWFAWYQCAFLFGAAAGGLVFGWLGDRIGRSKAMAASILCYSVLSGLTYFAATPMQLLILRFLTCMGVGGMWPTGVSLVAEAWSNMSRPMVAGIIGTSANVGIFCTAKLAAAVQIVPEQWRWIMLVGAAPVVLGLISAKFVPESPNWLATRSTTKEKKKKEKAPVAEIFQSKFLPITLVGITLATVPLFGGWGSANWMVPWAEEADELATATAEDEKPKPLKPLVLQARSLTGIVGSLLGGWIASFIGRRTCYFVISVGALASAQYAFWFLVPTDKWFLFWVSALGFFSGIYFGWLPLCLPELFPTRIRLTGAGVSFNFGRILTAMTIFLTGAMMSLFGGDYAKIGRVTSFIYAIGIIVILFAPDTSRQNLDDDET